MELVEIEARLSAIREELNAPGADLDALETEIRSLQTERTEIMTAQEQRKALLEDVEKNGATNIEINLNKGDIHMSEEKRYTVDSIEYRDAWLKKLQGKELNAEERAAMTGSAAIPTMTVNKIVEALDESPVISRVDVTHFPGGVTYPVESSVADSAWLAMGSASSPSADALTPVTLSAYKLIKTVEIDADVAAMAVADFEAWLVRRLVNKLEAAIDASIFVGAGSGSNQPTGIITTKQTADGTYTAAGATYADICGIIAELPAKFHRKACFAMTPATFYGEVIGMVDTTKNRVVVADAQSPAKFNILGFPVIVDDNITDDNILFGDFSYYKFNFAKDITVEPDSSVGFLTGSKVWRGMGLADGKLSIASAFVRYTKATN